MCDDVDPQATSAPIDVSDPDAVLARLASLVEERDRLQSRQHEITTAIHAALRAAHDAGFSWTEIARTTGYSSASVARNQADPRGPRPPAPRPPDPPGTYSVREAAQILDVSEPTVYTWIRSGRLQATRGRSRGQRVYLPVDTPGLDPKKPGRDTSR